MAATKTFSVLAKAALEDRTARRHAHGAWRIRFFVFSRPLAHLNSGVSLNWYDVHQPKHQIIERLKFQINTHISNSQSGG